jgi:hypothetical protein
MNASDQYSDSFEICPYCEHSRHVESGDYTGDGDDTARQCDNCGKSYYYHTSYSVSHRTRGDCVLNGEEHDYSECKSNPQVLVCSKCDKYTTKGGNK